MISGTPSAAGGERIRPKWGGKLPRTPFLGRERSVTGHKCGFGEESAHVGYTYPVLGRDLLLFPDSGECFARTLRNAALYGGRIHCPTFVGTPKTNEQHGAVMRRLRLELKSLAHHQKHALTRMEEHGDFLVRNSSELITAKQAGVLIDMDLPFVHGYLDVSQEGLKRFLESSFTERKWSPFSKQLARASATFRASLLDMELLCFPKELATDFNMVQQGLILKYLLGLIYMSEEKELTLTSWSPAFRRMIWDLQRLLAADSDLSSISAARVGQVVLDRRLPSVEDLPLDEVLRIRDHRRDELEAFRTGIAELAAKLDTSQPFEHLERQICSIVSTRIDPAVRRLRSAVAASRLDSIKRVFRRSWAVAAVKTSIPAVLAYLGSGRIEIGAAALTLGSLVLPIAEAEIERRRLLVSSPWSLLLKIK